MSTRNFKPRRRARRLVGERAKNRDPAYLIAKGTIDQLLKDRSTLIAEKTLSPSATATTQTKIKWSGDESARIKDHLIAFSPKFRIGFSAPM
jgi:hypothetical protein